MDRGAPASTQHAIVAHACYVRDAPGEAEVAFAVGDDWQGLEGAAPVRRAARELQARFADEGTPVDGFIVRTAALAAAHPELAELDLNPVVVSASGALVADARVRVERPPRRLPLAAL